MQSIGPEAMHKLNTQPVTISDSGGRVLPRLLRRPLRKMIRFFNEGHALSKRSLALICVFVTGSALAVSIAHSGKADQLFERAALTAGFQIDDIKISGGSEVSRIDVLSMLDLGPEKSLFSFDVHKARDDLKNLSWVHDVTVAKSYPDTLVISMVERIPFAIWQRGEELRIIARDGNEITSFDDRFANLPLVVGPGANESAADIISLTSRYPEIASRVKAFVRVGSRRWDLVLNNAVTIMLQAANPESSLIEFSGLERDFFISERAISRIDLRFDDRVVVALTDDGEVQHEEFVTAREQERSNQGEGI
ncbi:MAG: cell division protein FtsQ/DivIB [Rhizobiaceae bacterium]